MFLNSTFATWFQVYTRNYLGIEKSTFVITVADDNTSALTSHKSLHYTTVQT